MNWDKYDKQIESGPTGVGKFVTRILLIVVVIAVFFGAIGYVISWFSEGASVIKEEFGPRAMLEKYEWCKDAAAQLDKKNADITVYSSRLKSMEDSYEGLKRRSWDRTDKEQHNLWVQEVAGVKASFNSLAAEFNAQMSKFNWAFANVGTLPQGATDPLPREFKPYVVN